MARIYVIKDRYIVIDIYISSSYSKSNTRFLTFNTVEYGGGSSNDNFLGFSMHPT